MQSAKAKCKEKDKDKMLASWEQTSFLPGHASNFAKTKTKMKRQSAKSKCKDKMQRLRQNAKTKCKDKAKTKT